MSVIQDNTFEGVKMNIKVIKDATDDTYDLICECNADILNSYMDKTITQKEFIRQHIDYYTKGKE